MLSNDQIEFAAFACYSPRGQSSIEQKSREFKGAIKAANPKVLNSIFKYKEEIAAELPLFFNSTTTLIPIPRSSPLVDGALWPSLNIAKAFLSKDLGGSLSTCLRRSIPIVKSSSRFTSDGRPLVQDHLATLEVIPEIISGTSITLIDDVITAGRTAFACAKAISTVHPNIPIRVFAVIRTMSHDSISQIVSICVGTITLYPSGKTYRDP